jgi:hypothetical protein
MNLKYIDDFVKENEHLDKYTLLNKYTKSFINLTETDLERIINLAALRYETQNKYWNFVLIDTVIHYITNRSLKS